MLKRAGKYEILSELGRGGFGRVYRALDPVLGTVAIKTLTLENDPSVLTRFRNEAAAARRLSHPNIITIYDFGEQDGVPFIVMQLLEGQDLDKVIQKRVPLPLWQKVRIMTQAASGLFHAHSNGVIHRDVKPGNIMLLPDGDIKIMDFGIALASRDTHNRVTPTGTVVGTLRYMAPEQFSEAKQDARSDIFSFGLVFYELLSGIHPFYANEPATQMYNILNRDPVPILEVCPECPEKLQPVIERLLRKDRDLRYQSLEDVIFDCEPILHELQRANAENLFDQAKRARAEGRLDECQGLLRQAIDLDAAYPGLREFRDELQTELRRLSVRPRLEALAQEARDQLAAGNSIGAVQKLEAAARLDPSDTGVHALLEQAKSAAEQDRRVARLLADAERALNEGNPSGAQRMARQAVEAAPSSTRAHELLRRVQQVQAEQERQLRLADSLGRARRLLGIRAWDEAAEILETLRQDFPQHDEVRALSERLAASRRAEERQQMLTDELAAARGQIKAGDLEGGQARLTALRKEFPENSDLEQMLQAVESEIEARKHREAVEAALREARALSQQNAFEQALATLQTALDKYPSDLLLRSELGLVKTARRESEREAALRQALSAAQESEKQGKLAEALAPLESFLMKYGPEPAVEELQKAVSEKREEAKRAADLREMTNRVKELLAANKPEAAVQLLHDPPAAIRDHPELSRLRTLATVTMYRENERRAALDRALASGDKHRLAGDFDAAKQALAAFTSAFGNDPRVAEMDALIRRESESRRWADDLTRIEVRATELLALGEVDQAVQMLREQPSGVRGSPPIAKILAEAENRQRKLAEPPQTPESQAGPSSFVDSGTQALGPNAERDRIGREERRQIQRAIQEAEDLASRQNYSGAVARLEETAAQFPGDEMLRGELDRAMKARDLDRRHQEYVRGRVEYQAFLAKHQFEEAAGRIRQMLVRFPDDPQLQGDLEAANGAEQLRQKRLQMEAQIAGLETLFRSGDSEGVRTGAQRLLAEGEEPRVRELLISAEEAIRKAREIRDARRQPKGWLWFAGGGALAAVLGGIYLFSNHTVPSAPETPLRANPGEASFSYQQGGSLPPAKTVTVSGGASGAQWTATPSNRWIEAKPGDRGALMVSVRAQDLEPGDYTGVVSVSEKDEAPVIIQVRLQITRDSRSASQGKAGGEKSGSNATGTKASNRTQRQTGGGNNPPAKETAKPKTKEDLLKELNDSISNAK